MTYKYSNVLQHHFYHAYTSQGMYINKENDNHNNGMSLYFLEREKILCWYALLDSLLRYGDQDGGASLWEVCDLICDMILYVWRRGARPKTIISSRYRAADFWLTVLTQFLVGIPNCPYAPAKDWYISLLHKSQRMKAFQKTRWCGIL